MNSAHPAERRSFAAIVVCLISLSAVTFLGKSYESGLRGIDSNIHAAVSMSVTSNPGLAPRLPIPIKNFSAAAKPLEGSSLDPNLVFNDHPFFLFWVNGLIMRALGPSGWSARLLTGAFSIGSVCLTLAIGHLLVSEVFGVLAALLLIFCRDFILTSATVSLDTALVFFILLTFYLWLKKNTWGLGIAAGVGLWVKTPIVLLVFPVAVIYDALRKGADGRARLYRTFPKLAGAGLLALAVGSLVWIYTGFAGGWELVHDYWARQLWGTAVGGRGDQAQGWDWGRFFFYNLRTGFLPGLPLLAIALFQLARKRRFTTPSALIPGIAILVVGLTVTALRFKLGHYFTPIFPFAALLSAHSFASWLAQPSRQARFYLAITALTPLLLAFLLISPISFGPDAFVALRRFVPFIQTHGSCEDEILLIPGGEPVGAALDYRLYLTFYTGRTVQTSSCEQIAAKTDVDKWPTWLMVSDENLHCLPPAARTRYPTRLLAGTQYLLSSLTLLSPAFDLTPLELDHLAVTDCQAPRYPQDLWHRYLTPHDRN